MSSDMNNIESPYWTARKELLMYKIVKIIVDKIGKNAKSIIDIGSSECQYIDWFDQIPIRVALDKTSAYKSSTCVGVDEDFLTWTPDRRYDVALCLQVLDRLKNPKTFIRKMQSCAKAIVISISAPDDIETTAQMNAFYEANYQAAFGRKPNFIYLAREFISDSSRIIMVFERSDIMWTSIVDRGHKLAEKNKALKMV